jgi:hypothetical protein
MDERQKLVIDQLGRALRDVVPDKGTNLPSGLRDLLSLLRAADDAPQAAATTLVGFRRS